MEKIDQKELNEIVLKLELTVFEVNMILATLSKHPFEEVAALIGKIRAQGDGQVKEVLESKKENSTPTLTPVE